MDPQLDPRQRVHAFAANPREHVYQPSIVSTLFPHFAPARLHQTRWILLVGAIVLVLLAFGRFIPVAIVLAIVLIPVLYLLYFYEVQLYKDEPLSILGATFVAGAVLGAALSLALYRPLLGQAIGTIVPGQGPTLSRVLLTGLLVPILGQALMLVGPLILFFARPRFAELLDGFAFGAASGLGFAAAQGLVLSWLLLLGPLQQQGAASSWLLPVLRVGLLVPLLGAATTGLICAALWLSRTPQPAGARLGMLSSLPAAIVLATLGQIIPNLGSILLGGQIADLVWYGMTLLAMLLLVRHVIHFGLLRQAQALGHGSTMRCPHCFSAVPDVPFCPQCGLALRATAKSVRPATITAPPSAEPQTMPTVPPSSAGEGVEP